LSKEIDNSKTTWSNNKEIFSILTYTSELMKGVGSYYEALTYNLSNIIQDPIRKSYKNEMEKHKELRKKIDKF